MTPEQLLDIAPEPSAKLTVGARVRAKAVVNRRTAKSVYGYVVYVNEQNGWATVQLDVGHRESFWFRDLEPIDLLTLLNGGLSNARTSDSEASV